MADVREMRIFSADQIEVQQEVPRMLINYSKEVIRKNPQDIIKFSKQYFETLLKEQGFFDQQKKEEIKHDSNASKRDLQQDYKTHNLIGDESFSKARLAFQKNTNAQKVVRTIRKDEVYKIGVFDKKFPIFKSLTHPNLNKIDDVYDDNNHFYFVSNFIEGGDLFTALAKRKSPLTEKDAAHIIKQILLALQALHSKSIIHKNIKPDNILVVDDAERLNIKLVDYDHNDRKPVDAGLKQAFNPSYYIAPEQIKGISDSDKSDVWSVGALLYTIIIGSPPFFAETEKARVEKILSGSFSMSGPIWFDISSEAKDLIKQMLAMDLADRPHASNALKHPWFEKASDNQQINLEALEMFNAKEKLKQALIGFFASSINAPKMYESFIQTYQGLDKQKVGYMYMKDFMNVYQKIKGYNYDQDELEAIVQQIDPNKQGMVDYIAYAKAEASRFKFLYLESLEMTFGQFDRGGDRVKDSVAEYKELMSHWKQVDPVKVQKFEKKIAQLGDDGQHLMSLLKTIFRKIVKKE